MKAKILLSLMATLFLVGCSSSSDSNESSDNTTKIAMWDYVVPKQSSTLSFDKIITQDDVITSTEVGSFTHEYKVISNSEVNGSWRVFEGEYSITNDNEWIHFSLIDGQSVPSSVSGSFRTESELNSSLFMDGTGGPSYSETFAGTTYSYSSDSGTCTLNKKYDTITLYEGYSYNDVIEIRCERNISQSYSDDGSTYSINTPQIAYEYYQKNIGWIAKVDKDCIINTKGAYNFIDDTSESCLATVTTYQLLNN